MFFKKIDFLTPPITLFYKGDEAHSSVFSGIISLITYSIIFIFGVYYSLEFIYKKIQQHIFLIDILKILEIILLMLLQCSILFK